MLITVKEVDEGLFLELPQKILDVMKAQAGDEIELTPTRDGFLIEPIATQEKV